MLKIGILNGPNLNRLGKREPHIYGSETLEDLYSMLQTKASELGDIQLDYYQSNHEGALIDQIHLWEDNGLDGLVFNPAAYTHTSIALLDALKSCKLPSIEVHISDPSQRESFRQHSYISEACIQTIAGHGLKGYCIGLQKLVLFILENNK